MIAITSFVITRFCKKMAAIVSVLILGLLSLTCFGQHCEKSPTMVPDFIIQRLFDLVSDNQKRSEFLKVSDKVNMQTSGSYKCVIKINRFGDSLQTAQRWTINIEDDNVFVPMWVTMVLLEAHRYGAAPRPSDEQLISTVDFCSQFMDTTKPYNSSLVYFWKCVSAEASQSCTARSPSYLKLAEMFKAANVNNPANHYRTTGKERLEAFLKTFSEIAHIVTGVGNAGDIFLGVLKQFELFKLPTDADCTAVWLGLGSMLQMFNDEFLLASKTWAQYNVNISSIFTALKEFAYRPFSSDPSASTINTQSYYVLRHFLDDAKAAGTNVALVTTYFTSVKDALAQGSEFKFHKIVNDVDLTICANAINAITASILSDLISPEVLQDPELHAIYLSNSEMISYLINSNFSHRPDLAFPYYPSRYQFYWSVVRTVSIMDSYKKKDPLPLEVMELVFNSLRQAMDGEATRFLISAVQHNSDGSMYFDDFLGNGDVTDDNQPITRGEDRIFTTAMAANVLMYTWLIFDPSSETSQWRSETPGIVKETVDGCVQWLLEHALGGQFKPWNAFFSSQNKGRRNLPLRYPFNFVAELPQQSPSQKVPATEAIIGVKGYFPKSDYETMMNQNYFGSPAEAIFHGFNDPVYKEMLFWSSEPYTFAVTLLALTRYRAITVTDIHFCYK